MIEHYPSQRQVESGLSVATEVSAMAWSKVILGVLSMSGSSLLILASPMFVRTTGASIGQSWDVSAKDAIRAHSQVETFEHAIRKTYDFQATGS